MEAVKIIETNDEEYPEGDINVTQIQITVSKDQKKFKSGVGSMLKIEAQEAKSVYGEDAQVQRQCRMSSMEKNDSRGLSFQVSGGIFKNRFGGNKLRQ